MEDVYVEDVHVQVVTNVIKLTRRKTCLTI